VLRATINPTGRQAAAARQSRHQGVSIGTMFTHLTLTHWLTLHGVVTLVALL